MKILVTGSDGFIGKNLAAELKSRKGMDIFEYDRDSGPQQLDDFCRHADFVFHLAGVNRPKEETEFMEGNAVFTAGLLSALKKHRNYCPVMLASSVQAGLLNAYGESKKAGENLLFEYGRETGAEVLVYRFPNIFGKWCRPGYNSVVATFCHNIANGLPIQVNDPGTLLGLAYIDDVVAELLNALHGRECRRDGFCGLDAVHEITLGEIASLIYSFKESRNNRQVPDFSDKFTKNLYSTYLSYLPEDGFSYGLKMNTDSRGSFTEFIKMPDRGQVSVNILKKGITKGNHWHHTKNEKFLVASGKGAVRFRKVGSDSVIEYFVDGSRMEAVDIPVGYTHSIENLGDTDMVVIMWANEAFDPDRPDTYPMEV